MIYSRSNLSAVVCTGKQPAVLNTVHFIEGSTVAFDGKVLVAVSPVRQEVKDQVPETETPGSTLTLSAETIKEVLKNMPTDKKFYGLLEHTDLDENGTFRLTDGKRRRQIAGKLFSKEFIDYKSVLRKAKEAPPAVRVVLNRHRLKLLLDFLDKACPDGSNEAPVYLEFTREQDVLVRALNPVNGQRAIGYMTSYKAEEGQWLKPDHWEEKLSGTRTIEKWMDDTIDEKVQMWWFHENSESYFKATRQEVFNRNSAAGNEAPFCHELGPVISGEESEAETYHAQIVFDGKITVKPKAARPKAARRRDG